jgi:hypothetical protein
MDGCQILDGLQGERANGKVWMVQPTIFLAPESA